MSSMVCIASSDDLSYRSRDCRLLFYAALHHSLSAIRPCEYLFRIYEVPKNAITQL